MHKALLDAGYQMTFLSSDVLIKYLYVNHATTVLNPQLSSRQKSVDKGMRRIEKSLAKVNAEVVLRDGSLIFNGWDRHCEERFCDEAIQA